MKLPESYTDDSNLVCFIKPSLYSLKQISRRWIRYFLKFLSELRFRTREVDTRL